jgi:DNA segregation ATPase FtsK/SpoIIIE-like protein
MRSVYLMKTAHDLYKVGIAKDVESRRNGLQTSNGSKVLVVAHAKCGNATQLEKQVHRMLENYRQPGGREWFELTPEQAIKVCIFVNQQAAIYHEEEELRQLIDEASKLHHSLVVTQKELGDITQQLGLGIQKSIGRLRKYKPLPKTLPPPKRVVVKKNEDSTLLEQAKIVVRSEGKASTSLLQRRLQIGYGRAARIIEKLESSGFIGVADGPRAREVIG